jgi:hypothetical protein
MTTKTVRVDLPGVLYELAQQFGLETALKFADFYGGLRITIGTRPLRQDSDLVKAMGWPVARYLQKIYGAGPLLVPIGPASEYKKRTRLLRQMIASGESTSRIVRLCRVHTRTVEWNRQQLRMREDPRQLILFAGETRS